MENSKNLQFWKFQEFPIPKFSNLENFKDCQFRKFQNFPIQKMQRSPISKILKICDLKISKNFQFVKFRKYPIYQILKIVNLENSKNFGFENSKNFPNLTISKMRKFSKFYKLKKYENSINFHFYKLSYTLSVRIIYTNIKIKIKLENEKIELSFVLLIFEISKFQNIGRSTFGCSKCLPLSISTI